MTIRTEIGPLNLSQLYVSLLDRILGLFGLAYLSISTGLSFAYENSIWQFSQAFFSFFS